MLDVVDFVVLVSLCDVWVCVVVVMMVFVLIVINFNLGLVVWGFFLGGLWVVEVVDVVGVLLLVFMRV